MRVMVIVKATKESEAENSPLEMEGAAEMFEAMEKYNEALVKAGIMLAGDEIRPIWESEDFGPEIAAQVEAHREKIAKGGK